MTTFQYLLIDGVTFYELWHSFILWFEKLIFIVINGLFFQDIFTIHLYCFLANLEIGYFVISGNWLKIRKYIASWLCYLMQKSTCKTFWTWRYLYIFNVERFKILLTLKKKLIWVLLTFKNILFLLLIVVIYHNRLFIEVTFSTTASREERKLKFPSSLISYQHHELQQ